MSAGASNVGGDNDVSIPRGGPIYVQTTVGPLTRVSDFELSVFDELQSLKAEIGWDLIEICHDEISVDDLKIIEEEKLVSRAFDEAFKDGELIAKDTQTFKDDRIEMLGGESNTLEPVESPISAERLEGESNTLVPHVSSSSVALQNRESNKATSEDRKRKRRKRLTKSVDLEEGYVAKVQQLARIKQKQDEDKSAAKLHSFDGSCRNQRAICFQDKSKGMTSMKSISSSATVRASYAPEHIAVHFPEVILCVEVYHNRRTWSKTQEFLVLGQQFLSEIKDKIYCLSDEIMKREGQQDPSGYFLIEDVFCNDTREPSATDYIKPVFEWLEHTKDEALDKWEFIVSGEQHQQQKQKAFLDNNEGVPLPRFKAYDMQKTRFCDLKFRLGAGYLYCHQGDCKHTIIFRDMRLIHPEDLQNRAAYPLIAFQAKLRVRKCSVCNIYKATKITVDDKWAKENPCYFCDLCYYMLHYADGSLLYSDFSVYDYFHE